jgi:Family of unknown function (DUF6152)
MKRMLVSAIIIMTTLIVTTVPGLAHHSATMFDQSKTITVEGVVKKWELTNPHSWLWVEVKEKDGKTVVWGFEAEGPSTLQRAGIKPSDFTAGTKLTISGNPMRNGEKEAIWLNAVRTSDGKKFDPRAGFAVK